ncbi:hypothetical protein A2W24_04470 [Microgenomates group bacterium RBG_16_45_19]|nr:MAG: hypothetical protein A2W24_04470 [Microgenomates group bacterium RBG_16_45_19]
MYLKAKKLHRFLALLIVVLALIMMVTGSIMKFPLLFPFVDPLAARRLHNTLSPFFSLALFFMAASGLTMYFYPLYLKKKTTKKTLSSTAS